VLTGVTNLLVGYFEGKNLLIISDSFYDHFISVLTDDRALRSLQHLYSYTTYDYKVDHSFTVKLEGPCEKNELLIDHFYNTASIQPIQVIGENTNDVEFYAVVTRIIRHVDNKYLSYNPILGGGYTTAGRLEKCQNNNEIALCIVDSDIKYPNAKNGATLGELLSKYDPNNKYVFLLQIKVHEIENLLPIKFIEEHAKDEAKQFMQKIIIKKQLDLLRWYDIKSGVSVDDLQDKSYSTFVKKVYELLYGVKNDGFKKHVAQCIRNKKKVLPIIGKDFIKKYLKLPIEKQCVYSIYFKKEWKEIADSFYSFACSRENDPINI
jgi:hypothetical protein